MSAPPPSGSERLTRTAAYVLLVDDDDAIRSALRRFFSRRGWTVIEAPDGETAKLLLAPASGHAFDLVICDLAMPRVSGRDLYRWLTVHRPETVSKLVFSSGDTISPDASAFLVQTGRPVLPKPFELDELSRIVEDVWRDAHAA